MTEVQHDATPTNDLPTMEQLLANESYVPLERGDIRRGVVLSVSPAYVVIDIRGKREGFVPQRDLNRLDAEIRDQIVVGAEIPVYVITPEDKDGRAIVSISRGLIQADWDRAQALMESQEIWEGTASGFNRGGLLVAFGRIRGFIPASHVVGFPRSLPPEEKQHHLAEMVGRQLGLRIIEVDQRRNRLVLSERAAHREWREKQIERLLNELEEGSIIQGRVSSLQDFGAFVDLGGIDGLIHISELSWTRVDHPRDVLRPGEEVEVRVIRIDQQRKRISLSLRQVEGDPWERIEDRYTLGQLVTGQVNRIVNYGAFVQVEEGIEGLMHISELAEERVSTPEEMLEEGEMLPLRIIRIDAARRRLGLSFRRVTEKEWEEWRASRLPDQGSASSAEDLAAKEGSGEEDLASETILGEEAGETPPPSEATIDSTEPEEELQPDAADRSAIA